MPRLFIMENPQPNAFATGRNPQNGAVAVTTGLMQLVNKEEVAGVIAHELAHIKNRDTLLMTVTATIAGAISMVANVAMFSAARGNNNGIGALGTIALVILAPLAAGIVQMAISRTREYEADRVGAEISGDPIALASALKKIAGAAAANPQHGGRAQSGLGAYVHHQPAVGRAHGQSVLDPPRLSRTAWRS